MKMKMKMKMPTLNIKTTVLKFFAELMTSKYFLWFLTALSTINIIGYLSMGYIDAVVLFALVSFVTFIFSKNMSVVLLVSVIIVNLFMSTYGVSESLAVGKPSESKKVGNTISDIEPLTNKDDAVTNDPETEPAEVETETTTEEVDDDEEEEFTSATKKKKPTEESFQQLQPAVVKQHPHIDYGTTLTDAYKNLEKMLGEGGLKNLTTDTKKLMEQQSKLFNSMENIAPLLSQAQDLMKNMDMTQFSGKMGGLADSAEPLGKSKA